MESLANVETMERFALSFNILNNTRNVIKLLRFSSVFASMTKKSLGDISNYLHTKDTRMGFFITSKRAFSSTA